MYSRIICGANTDDQITKAIFYRHQLLADTSPVSYHPCGTDGQAVRQSKISRVVKKQGVSLRKGKLLFNLASYFKAGIMLELGTNLGAGAAFMALARPDGEVLTLEGSEELFSLSQRNAAEKGIHNIRFFQGLFRERLPDILSLVSTLDLVFFDGDHRQHATLDYFRQCVGKINNNTVFVFDDIHWSPGMENAWKEIVRDENVSLAVDLFHCGIVFFRKELSKQFFCLRF